MITAGLAGAFLLGRGRPEGLALMEDTPAGAWRSFAAALVCLPAFLAIRLFAWAHLGMPPGGLARALAAELIGYTLAWTAFALISLPLAQSWGRGADWPRFIAAWNWTNIVQYLVLLLLAVPGALGFPASIAQLLTFGGLAYAVWLEWFVARHALRLDGGRAAILVGVDLALGLFLGGLIRTLSGG
ncbi:hypothetical protein [Falsiroseomonas oryzae]|uniref:hypothetical protein n=1 Tax=Falsiroseomonas oryzae TaxID=2766473 RepID=UPI0022EAA6C3|nr:hypothetical protein [Roseomonas sp. MO-31]